VLDDHKQEEILDYFLNSDTDSLDVAMNDDRISEFTEEDVRMMRIKFLSEYAN
jgi:ATP-dependent DNA helicase RecQ